MSYTSYLASTGWLERRKRLLGDHHECMGCRSVAYRPQLHHLSYWNVGCETRCDVIPLCKPCHERVHKELRLRYGKLSLSQQAQRTRYVWWFLFHSEFDKARIACGWFAKPIAVSEPNGSKRYYSRPKTRRVRVSGSCQRLRGHLR